MKTFKEYLQEQRQIEIEEGLGRIIGSAIDTVASATARGAGRAARAAGRGLRKAAVKTGEGLGKAAVKTGEGLGKASKALVKAPFKLAGGALGAIGDILGAGRDHYGYHGHGRASDEKAARELGAQREREKIEREQEKARKDAETAEHAEMRMRGFDPRKPGRLEGFRHWKVVHRGIHLDDVRHPEHGRAYDTKNRDKKTGDYKFYPGTVRPSSIR